MPKYEQHPKKYYPLFRTPEQRIAALEAENAALREELAEAQIDLKTCETVLATIYQMFPDVALAIDLAAQKARGE